jgi:hypothetical protein
MPGSAVPFEAAAAAASIQGSTTAATSKPGAFAKTATPAVFVVCEVLWLRSVGSIKPILEMKRIPSGNACCSNGYSRLCIKALTLALVLYRKLMLALWPCPSYKYFPSVPYRPGTINGLFLDFVYLMTIMQYISR